MRIAAHSGAHVWGGAERGTSRTLDGMRERGHEVLLFCNDPRVSRSASPPGSFPWVGTSPFRTPCASPARCAAFLPDVSRVLSACDLFVLSSRKEGMANVMLEAMAVGPPVVATDVSGVAFALGKEAGAPPAGWIVPPENPPAMAAVIRTVLDALHSRPKEVRARVEEARRRARERFSIERMVDGVERALRGDEP